MYKIALTQVSFDNSYTNVLRFNSRAEQQAYFNVNTLFANITKEVNYPFGTFYVTRVPIRLDNTEQHEALSYNYAIVKDCNKEDTYFYYFVKNANYDSGNTQMLADLELDIFNTFYIDTEFSPCLVNRAHLDRWGEVADGKVSFNSNPDSLLFEQERIKTNSKRLVEREEIFYSPNNTYGDAIAGGRLDKMKKVKQWVYIYLKPTVKNGDPSIASKLFNYNPTQQYDTDYQPKISENCYCICFPVSDKLYLADESPSAVPRLWSFYKLCEVDSNNDTILSKIAPYILDVQITPFMPPWLFDYEHSGFALGEVLGQPDTILFKDTQGQFDRKIAIQFMSNGIAYLAIYENQPFTKRDMPYIQPIINLPFETQFNVADIIADTHQLKYNPKLLTQQYSELRLGMANATPQNYDILKLDISTNKDIQYRIIPNYQAGIFKCFFGIFKPEQNAIYNENLLKTYFGCSLSVDAGLIYDIDMLANFLAQNKNFYQIRSNEFLSRQINWLANIGKSTTYGSIVGSKGAISGAIGGALGGIANAIDIALDYENSNLTLDNMDNAPETFKNLDNAPYINLTLNDFKPYYEIWKPLECEMRIADNDMNMFGYTYNQIDNVKNCDNIRHYWNFVQAQLENITSTMIMSNEVREHFKNVFARGVRFWNITDLVTNDTYNYQTHENYERRLNDEL